MKIKQIGTGLMVAAMLTAGATTAFATNSDKDHSLQLVASKMFSSVASTERKDIPESTDFLHFEKLEGAATTAVLEMNTLPVSSIEAGKLTPAMVDLTSLSGDIQGAYVLDVSETMKSTITFADADGKTATLPKGAVAMTKIVTEATSK